MKKKTGLLALSILSLLLSGCNESNKKQDDVNDNTNTNINNNDNGNKNNTGDNGNKENQKDNTGDNTDSGNTGDNTGGDNTGNQDDNTGDNTGENTDSGNTGDNTGGDNTGNQDDNTGENINPTPAPLGKKMNDEAWNLMFNEEKLNNVKIDGIFSANMLSETEGVELIVSKGYEYSFFIDGNKIKSTTTEKHSSREVKDATIHELYETNPMYKAYFESEDKMYEALIAAFSSMGQITPVRNAADDGYIFEERENTEFNSYAEFAEDPLLVFVYEYKVDLDKYLKTTMYLETFYSFDGGTEHFIEYLKNLNGKFDAATYDGTKECYTMSFNSFTGVDSNNSRNNDTVIELYFNDGILVKAASLYESEGTKIEEDFAFSDYDKVNVTLPTNLTTCEHRFVTYDSNSDLHSTYCEECGGLVEYGFHNYVDGVCEECQFEQKEIEYITIGNHTHFAITKNAVTGEILDKDLMNVNPINGSSGLHLTYECDEEDSCGLIITYVGTTPVIKGCSICSTDTYSFTINGEKVHDDVIREFDNEDHQWELIDFSKKENCLDYDQYLNVGIGKVKCKNCGKIEDVEVDITDSTEKYDCVVVHQGKYEITLLSNFIVGHKIDETTHKCIYCNKDESELDVED